MRFMCAQYVHMICNRKNNKPCNERILLKEKFMDKEVEVVETTTVVEVGLRDQLVVTVLGAVAGLVASKLTEKAYFTVLARRNIARSTNN
jgi:hypothetical protein